MKRGKSLLGDFMVAHELHLPVSVVRDMPLDDYNGHLAYMQYRTDKRKQ